MRTPIENGRNGGCDPDASVFLRLFVALFLALLLLGAGYDASEGINHYELAQNLLHTGTLGLNNPTSPVFSRGPDGRMYAMHEIGNALGMLPWIRVGNTATKLLNGRVPLDKVDRVSTFLVCLNGPIELAALVTIFFWMLIRYFGIPAGVGLGTSVALGFATMLLQYSKQVYDGMLLSVLLLGALACAMRYAQRPRLWLAALSGLLLGYGVITKIPAVFFIPAILVWLALSAWRASHDRGEVLKALGVACLPLLAAAIWQGYYNHLRTGSMWLPPVLVGRSAVYHSFVGGNFFVALTGVLLSPGKSIFLYSPPLLIGFLGWRAMLRERPREALMLMGFVLPFFIWQCSWNYWTGDWGWGPRYFLIVIAPLFLPAVFWLRDAPSRRRRLWMAVLVWGLVIQVAAVWNNWQYRFAVLVLSGHSEREMIWSPRFNLWVDAVLNVGRNLERMAGWREWDIVPGSSPLHTQAANTVNVWWANTPLASRAQIALLIGIFLLCVVDFLLWKAVSAACSGTRTPGARLSLEVPSVAP